MAAQAIPPAQADTPAKAPAPLIVDLALVFMVTVWAGNVVVLKLLLAYVGPAALAGLRFAFLAVFALCVLAVTGGPWRVAREDVPRLVASALSGITLAQLFFMEGLNRTGAFASNVLQGMEPLFLVLLVRLTGAEPVSARQWRGVFTAVAGAVVFFLQDVGGSPVFAFGMGEVLNLLSASAFAAYAFVSRPLFVRYPAPTVLAYTIGMGGLPLLVLSVPSLLRLDYRAIPALVWPVMAASGILAAYVGFWIWNWGIRRKGLTYTSLYLFLDIAMSGFFTYLFLGERFGPWRLLGTLLILAGLHLARKA